jgi:hypothetical protein
MRKFRSTQRGAMHWNFNYKKLLTLLLIAIFALQNLFTPSFTPVYAEYIPGMPPNIDPGTAGSGRTRRLQSSHQYVAGYLQRGPGRRRRLVLV